MIFEASSRCLLAVEVEIRATPHPLTSRIGAARVLSRKDSGLVRGTRAGIRGVQVRRWLGISGCVLLEQDAAAATELVARSTAAKVLHTDDRGPRAVQVGVDVRAVRAATGLKGELSNVGFQRGCD